VKDQRDSPHVHFETMREANPKACRNRSQIRPSIADRSMSLGKSMSPVRPRRVFVTRTESSVSKIGTG
jgi:hypothetical protein